MIIEILLYRTCISKIIFVSNAKCHIQIYIYIYIYIHITYNIHIHILLTMISIILFITEDISLKNTN